jgi:hypothetical protein
VEGQGTLKFIVAHGFPPSSFLKLFCEDKHLTYLAGNGGGHALCQFVLYQIQTQLKGTILKEEKVKGRQKGCEKNTVTE